MSTEYHQLPSQQGFMPQDLLVEDPWLIAATSSLSLSSSDAWAPLKTSSKVPSMPRSPLLFEHSGHDSSSAVENGWKTVASPEMGVAATGNPLSQSSSALSSSPLRVKSPIVGMVSTSAPNMPKDFFPISSSTSKLDAWSMNSNILEGRRGRGVIGGSVGTPVLKSSHVHVTQPLSVSQPIGLPPHMSMQPLSMSQGDEDTKQIEDELAIQNRYKTELCKSYTETGVCRYGTKCQFAHGKDEVRSILRHPKYKTETCKTFHSTGTCPYGTRCRFIHTRAKEESSSPLGFSDEELILSGGLTPPPGIPVPQWSKSWSPTSSMPQKRFGNKKHGLGKITLIEAVPDF